MTIVPYENDRRAWMTLLPVAAELAQQIASTDFVPNSMRGNPPAIAATILYGDEVGIGPMQSLAKIAIINGRPTLAAEMQRALILQAGHDFWVEESTVSRCTVAGRRHNSEAISRVTWTLDDAKRAGLSGKQPWKTYPRQMLLARASAELARAVFPDAIGGLAATEEADDGGIIEGNGSAASASVPTARRKRAAITAPTPEPTAQEPPPLPAAAQEIIDELAAQTEEIPPNIDEKLTDKQKNNLNALVRRLRDDALLISTEHLWKAIADARSFEPEQMVELLHGRDFEGILHWAPLRDSLTKPEASDLIERLIKLEEDELAAEEDEA